MVLRRWRGDAMPGDALANEEPVAAVLTFTAPAAKKGEEDSCQSIPTVAPLNSGLSGFLPDVNAAQKLMRWPERVIIKLGAAY